MMQAWCCNLAKQTSQRLASSCSAASHPVAAHSKHPSHQACKSVLPQSGLTASLFSQVEAEPSWHSKVVSQLVRPSQQSAALASSSKQLPKKYSSAALQFRCSPQLMVSTGQRIQNFGSLLSPKAGPAQRNVPVQQSVSSSCKVSRQAADLSCPKGGQHVARLSTAASNSSSTAKQALQNLDPATVAKAHRLSIPVGLLAGVFGSFVGVGGGVLIVPLLTGACKGLPQRLVSGTSLVAVVSTALASSYTYLSHGVVDAGAALLISCCAVVTAPLGANLTTTLNPAALKKALGYFLVLVAFLVPLKSALFHNRQPVSASKPEPPKPSTSTTTHEASPNTAAAATAPPAGMLSSLSQSAKSSWAEMSWPTAFMLGTTGAAAGVASGLLGIGGGTIVTPLLAMLTPLTQAGVLGTSLLGMVAPSCVGLTQHARIGNVDWRLAAGLAAGTAVGSAAGSRVAVNAPAGVLEGIFSVGMLFLGWRTLSGTRKLVQKVVAPK